MPTHFHVKWTAKSRASSSRLLLREKQQGLNDFVFLGCAGLSAVVAVGQMLLALGTPIPLRNQIVERCEQLPEGAVRLLPSSTSTAAPHSEEEKEGRQWKQKQQQRRVA
ncbi:hypothetical protein DQ04_00711090 [Trypanosoma grayi]|uniref:hypothetical protein n=1 Tax=Trypanosoma grayi TaxID=71804 RepID=UPI0004F420F3|nr:hypothetical protein DQ04_00711090 [Trypanosoma grayi]KEG13931.1 hypothetical protein DQ04_00711090 [Trypanosoma grayi]